MAASSTATALKRTPFHSAHVELKAKMVPFAGYELPIQYPTGITAEHKAVRQTCGVFDVSHMGEFIITGDKAVDFVNYVTTNDVSKLAIGQAHYSTICNDRGTIEDDCLVYRYADHLMMVVNGSNKDKDLAHIQGHASRFHAKIEDRTEDIALLAVQGPDAEKILRPLTPANLESIGYYHFTETTVDGVKCTLSRTGYTGEDGFEIYHDAKDAMRVWNALMATNAITSCGLGCRDSLRLEAGMALYGNDIDDTTTPLEANLAWLVKLQKGDFVGREALQRQKAEGVKRKLVGFTSGERVFPRHGYPVFVNGEASGEVRSGTLSPTLEIPVGTCYVPTASAAEGSALELEVRGKRIPARVVKMPFYKREAARAS